MEENINIKLLDGAHTPTRATAGACAYDLYASADGSIEPHTVGMINTGVCMSLPPHLYAKIECRSGLARNYGLIALGTICDSDYRGPYIVMLLNSGNARFDYKKNDRIAQVIFHRYEVARFNLVDDLDATARGTSGFGSTG